MESRPLKIVHALAYYGNYLGGIQIYTEELTKKQKEEGHNVKIITSDLYDSRVKVNGIQVVRVKSLFSLFRVPFTPLLPYYLLKEKCDVLHVHLPLPWLDLCVALKKLIHPETKLIITIHNYTPTKSLISKIFARFHNSFSIRIALNKADHIITTTKPFMQSLPYKINKTKLRIIPLGIDLNKFHRLNKPIKNQILFVGRLIPEKGLHVLIEAVKLARLKNYNLKVLAICSETYDYQDYEKELREKGKNFLTIKKNVPNNSMKDFYSESSCLVMPSLDLDSFGYVLIEAMACGCPVITSDLPGPASVVNRKCGAVVPKGNAKILSEKILLLLKNNEKMRVPTRNYIKKNFSWDIIYKKVMEVYRG